MPQSEESTRARRLTAYTLEWRVNNQPSRFLTLPINPQSVNVTEPARTTAQQTLSAVYLEEWGAGLKPIVLEGHTGFSMKSRLPGIEPMDGFQAFKALKALYREYLEVARANALNREGPDTPMELILHMWEEDEHWRVVPNGQEAFRRPRSGDRPLLFPYTLSLLAVEDITKPSDAALKLKNDLLGDPKFDDLLGDFTEGASFFTNLANLGVGGITIGSVVNGVAGGLAAAATFIASGLNSFATRIKAVGAGLRSGFDKAFGEIARLKSACRNLMKAVSGVVALGTMAIRIARQARKALCGLRHLDQILKRYAQNLFGPFMREWNGLKRDLSRQC